MGTVHPALRTTRSQRIRTKIPVIHVDHIEIPLTQGRVALLDLVDLNFSDVCWYWQETKNNCKSGLGYARRRYIDDDGESKQILMHRLIMEQIIGRPVHQDLVIDHIDRNGLNNRRSNLRIVTHQLNMLNKDTFSDQSNTGYMGIVRMQSGTYRVKCQHKHIGTYATFDEARIAREVAMWEATQALTDAFLDSMWVTA